MQTTETISLIFELDACPVIGVKGRTVQFLNAAARAYYPDAIAGSAIRRLLPAHIALHQASAFLATAKIHGAVHVVTVTSMPGLRLFRLEPVTTDAEFPDFLVPSDLFSMELGLATSFFSAHAAQLGDPTVLHYAARLKQTSDQLRRWVHNASILQKLYRSKPSPAAHSIDCAASLAAITETIQLMLDRRQIRLSLTVPESPCRVRIPSDLFEALVLNLLSNAVKNCADGAQISVNLTSETSNAHLSIQDAGCGFPERILTDVFHAYRTGTLPRSDQSHAGYGLPVCFAITDAVNGSLLIENNRGNGASVHIFLPLVSTGKAVLHSPDAPEPAANPDLWRIGISDALSDEDYSPDKA